MNKNTNDTELLKLIEFVDEGYWVRRHAYPSTLVEGLLYPPTLTRKVSGGEVILRPVDDKLYNAAGSFIGGRDFDFDTYSGSYEVLMDCVGSDGNTYEHCTGNYPKGRSAALLAAFRLSTVKS